MAYRLRGIIAPHTHTIRGLKLREAGGQAATAERNRLGLGEGPVRDLGDILEQEAGMRIFRIGMPPQARGLLACAPKLGGCIAVNACHPEEERQWLLAHAYGHFLTGHFPPAISVPAPRGHLSPAGQFADAFANAFLLPASGLRRKFQATSHEAEGRITAAEICRLAHCWGVSVQALVLRLEDLRLVPNGTWIRLRGQGASDGETLTPSVSDAHAYSDSPVSLCYRLLAVQAFVRERVTEGLLTRLLRTDRLSARAVVQRLAPPLPLLDDGGMAIPALDCAYGMAQDRTHGPQPA